VHFPKVFYVQVLCTVAKKEKKKSALSQGILCMGAFLYGTAF
jgi:hypothetical protein